MILIKRYANRKLYNTESSRYITLKGVAELIEAGKEVRVIDNETGEDITSVALSQILVDNERSNNTVQPGLLGKILERGGDALYDALRTRIDEATEGIGEIQDRMKRLVHTEDATSDPTPEASPSEGAAPSRFGERGFFPGPDFEKLVQSAVERVFRLLDLPRRSDVDALNRNLEQVAAAVERLERAMPSQAAPSGADTEPGEQESPQPRAHS